MGRTVITRVPAQGFVCSCVYFLFFTFILVILRREEIKIITLVMIPYDIQFANIMIINVPYDMVWYVFLSSWNDSRILPFSFSFSFLLLLLLNREKEGGKEDERSSSPSCRMIV